MNGELDREAKFFLESYRENSRFNQTNTYETAFAILDSNANILAINKINSNQILNDFIFRVKENKSYHQHDNYKAIILSDGLGRNKVFVVVVKEIVLVQKLIIFLSIAYISIILLLFLIYWQSSHYLEDHMIIPINSIINFSKNFSGLDAYEELETDSDLIEVVELYDKFNYLLKNIEDSIDKIEDFSTNVSHELRTPITSIKQSIEVELSQERSKEEYIELVIKVLDDVNWMNSIINDMLLLGKLSSSNEVLDLEEVNIKLLIEEICEMMEFTSFESNINFEYSSLDDINILCDKGKIKRLLVNLIANSVKYNKDDGFIYVYTDIEDNKISISVRDTGIGIKEENLNKITEKFFREDKARTSKKSGVGLGLSISKHIIELHKGKLKIDSEEGIGSTFTVTLPINGGKDGFL